MDVMSVNGIRFVPPSPTQLYLRVLPMDRNYFVNVKGNLLTHLINLSLDK